MRGGRGIKGGFSCDDTNVSSIVRTANSKAAGQLASREEEGGGRGEERREWKEIETKARFNVFFLEN